MVVHLVEPTNHRKHLVKLGIDDSPQDGASKPPEKKTVGSLLRGEFVEGRVDQARRLARRTTVTPSVGSQCAKRRVSGLQNRESRANNWKRFLIFLPAERKPWEGSTTE